MLLIPVTSGAEVGGLEIQGLPGLQGEFYTALQILYRLCFKVKNKKTVAII